MNIPLMIGLGFLALLAVSWMVYNFVWLNKPQVYLVYKPNSSFAYDLTQADSIAKSFGGTPATIDQFVNSFKAGASNCTFGYVSCAGCGISGATGIQCTGFCAPGATFANLLPLNAVGATGPIPSCGPNNAISGNTTDAGGYWVYGPKPSAALVAGWTIAPFHQKLTATDYETFNRFEIFGIPKVF